MVMLRSGAGRRTDHHPANLSTGWSVGGGAAARTGVTHVLGGVCQPVTSVGCVVCDSLLDTFTYVGCVFGGVNGGWLAALRPDLSAGLVAARSVLRRHLCSFRTCSPVRLIGGGLVGLLGDWLPVGLLGDRL